MDSISIANKYASDMVGEYIDSLGKTDLAEYSLKEWQTLIDVITKNYHEKYIDNVNDDDINEDIPF